VTGAKSKHGLQIRANGFSPHPQFGYRSKVGEYVTKSKIKVAVSKTLANPQHGVGGAWQVFVDDFANNLNLSKEINLQ